MAARSKSPKRAAKSPRGAAGQRGLARRRSATPTKRVVGGETRRGRSPSSRSGEVVGGASSTTGSAAKKKDARLPSADRGKAEKIEGSLAGVSMSKVGPPHHGNTRKEENIILCLQCLSRVAAWKMLSLDQCRLHMGPGDSIVGVVPFLFSFYIFNQGPRAPPPSPSSMKI